MKRAFELKKKTFLLVSQVLSFRHAKCVMGKLTICPDWFKFHISSCKQFFSTHGNNSSLVSVGCGLKQNSALQPPLLLIYIDDLHKVIQLSKKHHFIDDANLFHAKMANWDIKLLICKSPRKIFSDEIEIKLIWETLYPSKSIEYLGIKIGIFLHQYDDI